MTLRIKWLDHGREPQCKPDPKHPDGVHIDLSQGAEKFCSANFPYPAKRCGLFIVVCDVCGTSAGITTAGRNDDPRTISIKCKPTEANHARKH